MTAPAPLDDLLRRHPLPPVDGDKRARGTAVLVGGSVTCAGAALLAATAALRAGAGRVQVVTVPEVAAHLGLALPEALVVGWSGTEPVPPRVRDLLERAGAVAVGPGMEDDAVATACAVGQHVPDGVPLLLDAQALDATKRLLDAGRDVVVAPNAAEATRLLGETGDDDGDEGDVVGLARRLVSDLACAAAVRGRATAVATADDLWCTDGARGLGTAGSGDVFAGVVLGLLARGVDHHVALGWAVASHRWAGAHLAGDRANPGYLARELLDVLPDAMEAVRP